MAALLGAVLVLSLVAAAGNGDTPGSMLMLALPAWASFLPVALLPRRAAIIAGSVITTGCLLLTGLMAYLVLSPGHGSGDGMWKIGAFLFGLGTAFLTLVHGGATLARWSIGRGQA